MTRRQAMFSIIASKITKKYGVTLHINWEKAFVTFEGELSGFDWQNLFQELNDLAKRLEVENEQTKAWF